MDNYFEVLSWFNLNNTKDERKYLQDLIYLNFKNEVNNNMKYIEKKEIVISNISTYEKHLFGSIRESFCFIDEQQKGLWKMVIKVFLKNEYWIGAVEIYKEEEK